MRGRWRAARRRGIAPALLALAVGCSPSPPPAERDPAGALVVHLPDLASAAVPRWTTRVVFSTDGLDLPPLTRFTDARILGDSTVLIADETSLLHLSPSGSILGSIGRAGSGPGEYQRIFRVGISPDGEILVSDFRNERVTLLDSTLRLRQIIPRLSLATGYELEAIGLLGPNRIVAGYWQQRPNRDERGLTLAGHDRDSAPLLIFDTLGALRQRLGPWPGLERVPVPFGQIPPAFARSTLMHSRGRFTAVTPTDSVAVTLFADTAVVLRLHGGVGSRQPTRQDELRFEEGVRDQLADVVDEYLDAIRRGATVPRMPTLGGLAVDGDGNAWIGATPGPADSVRPWFVISPRGAILGRLSLPFFATVAIPGRREVLDVAGGRLVLLRESPVGEISVELREILRPS